MVSSRLSRPDRLWSQDGSFLRACPRTHNACGLGRGSSFQAGRGLIQLRRPLPQRGGDLSGRFVPDICDCHKRLDPKFNAVARPLIRLRDIARSYQP
jgi:hypothetical protein